MSFGQSPAHYSIRLPAYVLWVKVRPFSEQSEKGKAAYRAAVIAEAQGKISHPIRANDIEIDIVHCSKEGAIVDIDKAVRPTLNALEGIAYVNDRQVRCVSSTRFDMTDSFSFQGNLAIMRELVSNPEGDHKVGILIYSQDLLFRRLEEQRRRQIVQDSARPDPARDIAAGQTAALVSEAAVSEAAAQPHWTHIPHVWGPPEFEKRIPELLDRARGGRQFFSVADEGPPRISTKGWVELTKAEILFGQDPAVARDVWQFQFELPADSDFWPIFTRVVHQLGEPLGLRTTGGVPLYPTRPDGTVPVIGLVACWLVEAPR